MPLPPQISRILLSEDQIQHKVGELGLKISQDYRGRIPIFVGILRGAAMFHADLIRHVDLQLQVDFISVSSYGAATRTSGQVQLIKDLESSIQGEDILLIEDIIDTGLTAEYLLRNLSARRPRSIRFCSLLSKPSRRQVDIEIDYLGFEIPDDFVVGYGLDYNQQFRNLPFIGVLDPSAS